MKPEEIKEELKDELLEQAEGGVIVINTDKIEKYEVERKLKP